MLDLNLSNSLDQSLHNQLISNFKIIDQALDGNQGISQEQLDNALKGIRNIAQKSINWTIFIQLIRRHLRYDCDYKN